MCVDVWFIQVRLWKPSVQVYVFMHASVHGWSRVALSDKGHAGVRVCVGSCCVEGGVGSRQQSVSGH